MDKRCCMNCINAVWLASRWFRVFLAHAPGLMACISHPDSPGQLVGVSCAGVCPNFRPRHERPVRSAPLEPPDGSIRYIPLTQGKHAIVDAEDYERVSRHKWCVSRSGNMVYAQRRRHPRNTTGYTGVYRNKKTGKYSARSSAAASRCVSAHSTRPSKPPEPTTTKPANSSANSPA